MKTRIDTLWERNYAYAASHNYRLTRAALEEIRGTHMDADAPAAMVSEYLIHGLSMAWLLIELRLPVTDAELDLMLSASVLHILVEMYGETGMDDSTAPEEVRDFVRKIAEADRNPGIAPENRLLLMVKLVERSNLIEHLCDMSPDEAKQFMREAKRIWFSVCLEGKTRYPEFDAALTGILEKMRGLIQVIDILFKRFDAEEDELYEEIFNLKEENARIRLTMEYRRKSI